MNPKDTFCSHCGTPFGYNAPAYYPRECHTCQVITYSNPTPVSVVLVPVEHENRLGLLVVRRGIEPGKGKIALPGGFVDHDEACGRAGAREVKEETGVSIAPYLKPLWFASSTPRANRVLLFGESTTRVTSPLPPLPSTIEVSERGVVFGPRLMEELFAFPLHWLAAARWFEAQDMDGPHDYTVL